MAKEIQIITKDWIDALPAALKKSTDEARIRLEKIAKLRIMALNSLQKKLKEK